VDWVKRIQIHAVWLNTATGGLYLSTVGSFYNEQWRLWRRFRHSALRIANHRRKTPRAATASIGTVRSRLWLGRYRWCIYREVKQSLGRLTIQSFARIAAIFTDRRREKSV
jgi:hypothetical protein